MTTKVEDLRSRIAELHELLSGGILKDFLNQEDYLAALPRFQEGLLELSFLHDQLKAEVDAEKTKFRRDAYDKFQELLAEGTDKSQYSTIKRGNLVATARYVKEMFYSVDEICELFQKNDLPLPICKTTIDTKLLDTKQRKFYKSLEKTTGLTVVIKEAGDNEEGDE